MSDELKKLEAIHEMTSTEGWKELMEEAESRLKVISSIEGVHSEPSLFYAKGQLTELTYLLNLRTFVGDQIDRIASGEDNDYDYQGQGASPNNHNHP